MDPSPKRAFRILEDWDPGNQSGDGPSPQLKVQRGQEGWAHRRNGDWAHITLGLLPSYATLGWVPRRVLNIRPLAAFPLPVRVVQNTAPADPSDHP